MTFRANPYFSFYLKQQIRSRRWYVGAVVFAIVYTISQQSDQEPFAGFSTAILLGVMAAINFGIAANRRTGFSSFVAHHVSPFDDLVTKIAVTALLCLIFVFGAAIVSVAISQSLQLTLWYTCRSLLLLGLVLPATLLIELVLNTELAGLVSSLLAVIALVVGFTSSPERFMTFMGLELVPGSYVSLGRLLSLNFTWNLLMAGAALIVWRFQERAYRIILPK